MIVTGSTALHAINIYLVTAMLPSVVGDIGGQRFYAWSTTLFMFASVVAAILVPRGLAVLGARRAFGLGLVAFGLGTLACALAPDIAVLLAGRTVQGIGGGLLMGLSYAMIRTALPQSFWAPITGLLSAMWGVGNLVGPALGGAFAQVGHWRLAFVVLLPFVLGVAALLRALPGKRPAEALEPVAAGNLGLIAAAVLAVSAGSVSDHAALNGGGLAAGLALLAGFALRERSRTPRLLPPRPSVAVRPCHDAGTGTVLLWSALLLVAGSGVGISWPHLSVAAMATGTTGHEQAVAGASVITVQLVATSLGAALAGMIVNLGGDAANAARWLYGVFAALVALGVLWAYRAVRERRPAREPQLARADVASCRA